jgi:hypothetical protein
MLRTSLSCLALAAAAALASSSAFAFFDAEVQAGKRWYKIDNDQKTGIASQEVDVAAHIDPIPLVPVAFGAKIEAGTLNPNDFKSGGGYQSIDTAAVFEAGLDVMAWIPMVPVVTPYVRLDVPVTGTMTVKGTVTSPTDPTKTVDSAATETITGMSLGVGVKWAPAPLVKILVELQNGMEKIKEDTIKVDGVTLPNDTKTYNLASNAFLMGVEIGF